MHSLARRISGATTPPKHEDSASDGSVTVEVSPNSKQQSPGIGKRHVAFTQSTEHHQAHLVSPKPNYAFAINGVTPVDEHPAQRAVVSRLPLSVHETTVQLRYDGNIGTPMDRSEMDIPEKRKPHDGQRRRSTDGFAPQVPLATRTTPLCFAPAPHSAGIPLGSMVTMPLTKQLPLKEHPGSTVAAMHRTQVRAPPPMPCPSITLPIALTVTIVNQSKLT